MPSLPRADWGAKAILVLILAFLMGIPGLLVYSLVQERAQRDHTVTDEVSNLRGGQQQLLGPIFVAPFTRTNEKGETAGSGWWVVSPQQGTATASVKSSSLHRGIFEVPVYDATVDFTAKFGPLQQTAPPPNMHVDWSQGRMVVGFTDLRGARADLIGQFTGPKGKSEIAFAPISSLNLAGATQAGDSSAGGYAGFGLVAGDSNPFSTNPEGGQLTVRIGLSGAQRLSVMPFAKTTTVKMVGDWSSPSFDGGFLPVSRQVRDHFFSADWAIPFVGRGLSEQGTTDALSLSALGDRNVGVTFARANNPYENVSRSFKYGIMFVGLVFLTFFVFEALSGQRLHAAQYVMIGLAQMVFYLLLLSLSEYVGFDVGFAVASVATVGLISLYAGWAFHSARYRLQALVIFSILYALIYGLMQLEDFALLAGSLASFTGLAVAMYLTRNLEWYAAKPADLAPPPTVTPGSS